MKLVPRERFESAGNSSPINTLFKLAMSETSCGPSTTAYPAILRFYHARVMFGVFFRDSNSFGKFFAASNNNPSMTLRPHDKYPRLIAGITVATAMACTRSSQLAIAIQRWTVLNPQR